MSYLVVILALILAVAKLETTAEDNVVLGTDILQYVTHELNRLESKYKAGINELRQELADTKENFGHEIERLYIKMSSEKMMHRRKMLRLERRIHMLEDDVHHKTEVTEEIGTLPQSISKTSEYPDENSTQRSPGKLPTDHEIAGAQILDGRDNRKNVRNNRQTKRQYTDPIVAFFASVSQNKDHLGASQDIVFDHVETNLGSGYNSRHGIFVAPVPGVYVINSAIRCYKHGVVKAQVVKNGQPVARFTSMMYGTIDIQSSQTVILSLHVGDDVAIQTVAANSFVGGDKYSTFSGFLLYPFPSNVTLPVGK